MTAGSEIARARPRVIAALAAQLRDLDAAEDAFAEAAAAYLEKEVRADNPGAWLFTVAKRKAIDAMRRRDAEEKAADGAALVSDMADIIELPEAIPDERLRLIFICCHPAIALEARTALALKVICGLPVAEIARVFVASEPTMFQRITRAKAKVCDAGIDFELPPRRMWCERLDAVLLTLELAYTVAYQDAAAERAQIDGDELAGEVQRLADMLAELLPEEPEVLGLAALVNLARSREAARVEGEGAMVPLSEQDTASWDFDAIERARALLDSAATYGRTGPYQLMAAIQLTHARRAFDGATDWAAILKLYDALALLRPGPVTALNRALALARVEGPQAALDAIEGLPVGKLENLRPYRAAKADLLARLERTDEAASAYRAVLELDPPRAERLFLEARLAELASD